MPTAPPREVRCPLCSSSQSSLTCTIRAADLTTVYRSAVQFAVDREFGHRQVLGFYSCLACDLRFFLPAVTGSEQFYRHLQTLPWYYQADKQEYRFAAGLIPGAARVLDVGCGTGAFARFVSHAQYVGLEFNHAAQAEAATRGLQVLTEPVEAHAAAYEGRYDVVCAFQVLEHIADVQGFIEACVACAKEGGLIVLSVPSADGFLGRVVNNALNLPPHHVTWWTDTCLTRLAPLFGLELVALRHEALAPAHEPAYAHLRLMTLIGATSPHEPKLLDTSRHYRFLARVAVPFSRVLRRWLRNGSSRGHTVTAVYRRTRLVQRQRVRPA